MISKSVLGAVDAGRLGFNKGLPHGFDRLVEYIPDIQKSTYYLCGGESGVGKSAFAYNTFMLNPLDYYLGVKDNMNIKVDVLLYSFELTKEKVLVKAVCRDIYKTHGILLDINYALSKGKYRISDEHYKLVKESADRLEQISDCVHIWDIPTNPTGVYKNIIDFASKNGSGIGDFTNGNTILNYKPHHSNHYVIVIIDHISLSLKERGFNTKDIIDKLSEYLVLLRNKLGITPVVIQQLNRSMSSTDRFRLERVEPQLSDFKDSGNTIQDSDIVMALHSPHRYEMNTHRKYDITKLKDRFRQLGILKNRDGESDKNLGMLFVGECGLFKELPRVEEVTDEYYNKINSIKKSFKVIE